MGCRSRWRSARGSHPDSDIYLDKLLFTQTMPGTGRGTWAGKGLRQALLWCAGKCIIVGSLRKEWGRCVLICSICLFLWCKYFHVTNVTWTSLHNSWKMNTRLLSAGTSQLQHNAGHCCPFCDNYARSGLLGEMKCSSECDSRNFL